MTIIYLTPGCLIATESAFTWQPGGTIMAGFELPQPAGPILGIQTGRALKVLPHISDIIGRTYGFIWNRVAYRVVVDWPGAPVPLELAGIAHHDHWHDCKACRDGAWCETGMGIICAEMDTWEARA